MRTLFALVALFALPACGDDHDHEHDDTDMTDDTDAADDTDMADDTDASEPPTWVPLATGTDGTITVELLGWHGLLVGWNEVAFKVTDGGGAAVTGATVTHAPLMDMEEMDHACPYSQPVEGDDGVYLAELVPIMASGMMGSWGDTVSVDIGGTVHTVELADLEVAETNRKKDLDVDGTPWIVTLTPTSEVEVGDVTFVATVHHRATMMDFPAVEDLDIVVTPWMPSMGHGSMGNVDPVYAANGRYEGAMNFSMGGAWTVTLEISQGGLPLGDVEFDFEL
jgi:hypothetical protein